MYDFDVTYPAPISGILSDGQRQIANMSDLLTNSSDSYQTVTYHFRPYIQGKPGDPTCHDGVEITILVHVEPTAKVVLTLADNELCNGDSVNIQLSSVTNAYQGVEFNVHALNDYPEIEGYTDTTGLIVTDLITEPLTNNGDTARIVTYVVSPVTLDVNGNQKCYGINDTVRVWINPTPRATPLNNAPQICYGDTTDIVLLSPTVMSSGINQFNYTISATAPTSVVDGNWIPLNNVAPGTHLQFPYTNESDTMQSVFFRITPKVTGPGCPYGPPFTSEVKVHAHPLQSLEILDSITCEGGQNGALEIIHSRGLDQMWVEWTGPDYWEDEGYNLFLAEECSQGYYTAKVTDSLGCVSSADLNLIEPNTELSFYFNPYISCPGAGDATATIALTEGQAPPYYYYLIRNAADTVYQGSMSLGVFFNLDNLIPGDYILSVEDGNGCKKELPQTLYDAPATTVKFDKSLSGEHNISCEGYFDGSISVSQISSWYMDGTDTVFVTSRVPYTYEWTSSEGGVITGSNTDSLLVGIPAGTYSLTVRDNLGCEFYFTEVMTEPDGIDLLDEDISLSADGNYEISCHGGTNGYIDLQFDGGTGAYSYSWTGPGGYTANTASLTGISAGTYNLIVTDANMCHREYEYTLDEPDSLTIGLISSLTPDGAFNIGCNGGDGTIDITVGGGSGPGTYSYNWTVTEDPAWLSNQEDVTVKAGHYQLLVTDVNGCTNSRTILITEPDPLNVTLDVADITCLNSPSFNDGSIDLTVAGGKAPYSYSWTGPSGFNSSLEDISSLTEGTYTVTVTDAYGCVISADTILSLPEQLAIDAHLSDYNGFSISCLGRSDGWIKVVPQTGSTPYEYTWTGPEGFTATATDSIHSLSEGTYTVTVTDRNLCTVTQNIALASPGQLSMTLSIGLSNGGNFNINCAGAATGRVTVAPVNAAGATTYLWSDGQSGASRDNLPAGIQEVILTDANGCVADTSLTLTQPDSLRISFSMISPYCPESKDGSIFAGVTGGEGAYTFSWSNGQTTQEADGLVQGLHIVEARDFNGCQLSDSLLLKPLNDICVGIPNAFSPDGDGINDFWNIARIAFYTEAEVIILNRWGEMVWKSGNGYTEPWDGRASNGKELPMDSYHYAIDLHNGEKPIVGHVTIIR
jgi:gliding motility-associated-like protein